MSTTCLVHFASGRRHRAEDTEISVYVHWNGYPDGATGMASTLGLFVSELERCCRATLAFDDPPATASKFIVFLAKKYTEGSKWYLDFSSPFVVDWREYQVQYEYFFDCRTLQFHWRRNV